MKDASENRVLLTGSTGLVGRAVARRLKAAGFDLIEVARTLQSGKGAKSIDLTCQPLVGTIDDEIGHIVHLAAAVPAPGRHPDSEESARLIRQMDENVLEFAQHTNAPVVYASACSLYDKRDTSFKDEHCELIATSPYLAAKLQGESRFRSALRDTAVIRISSPFDTGIAGHLVLAKFIDGAKRNEAIQVWGTGTREQDFVHAEDIGDFVINLLADYRSGTWNIASGIPLTMRELANMVISAAGSGKIGQLGEAEDPREGETARYSTLMARRDFGWKPCRSLLDWIKASTSASHK